MKAWSYGLDRYLLLYHDNGVVVGASYTDIHVELPILWLLMGLSIVAALGLVANFRVRAYRLPAHRWWCLSSGAPWCSAGVVPALFQRVFAQPDNCSGRASWKKHNMRLRPGRPTILVPHHGETVPPNGTLRLRHNSRANKATIDNIRLSRNWQPLDNTYAQLQEGIRTFTSSMTWMSIATGARRRLRER